MTVKSTATSTPASHERVGARRDLDARAADAELPEVDTGVMRVDRGDQLELGVVDDRAADGRAHAPAGAEHADLDHARAHYRRARTGRRVPP